MQRQKGQVVVRTHGMLLDVPTSAASPPLARAQVP